MKKILILVLLFPIVTLILTGCSTTGENGLTIKNGASNKIYINFRGSLISIDASSSMEIKDITRGTYTYETTFEIPAGTMTTKTEGAVSGQVTLNAGTKVLIVYSSTFSDGIYTLSATISSSDDIYGGNDDPVLP